MSLWQVRAAQVKGAGQVKMGAGEEREDEGGVKVRRKWVKGMTGVRWSK